jgi:acetyl-CoA carboxylase biotin carboxyl carrier protein
VKISEIAEVASLMSDAGIGTWELSAPDYKIRLTRIHQAPSALTASSGAGPDTQTSHQQPTDIVASPGVGIFLHAHPVYEMNLVEPNQPVSAGQPIGLLQIGPILMPVLSPRDGVVASHVAPDASLVGYGDPLVELLP